MTQKTREIAVITGDIVGSTALGPAKLERAMTALADCARVQADWHGESLRFTRNRGDGWQVALARPEMALRSALAFRAALRANEQNTDTYISIAEGITPIDLATDLNSQTEQVFIESGQGLDGLKRTSTNIRMVHDKLGSDHAAVILADYIVQDWTPTQAWTMFAALNPSLSGSYTQIADKLGKTRQAVTKSLKAAAFEHIELALATLEKDARND